MGAADVVPGVSGGTIAFITGIYEELLETISSVNLKVLGVWKKDGFMAAWQSINGSFLLALFTGIFTSILSLARGISYLLENHAELLWAFFFGLVLASVFYMGKQVQGWDFKTILGLVIGAAFAFYITLLPPMGNSSEYWYILVCGSIAICAMILPGISGSFILLLLGAYTTVIDALKNLELDILALFAIGCVIGLAAFSRVLNYMFKKAKNLTIAVLCGFLIGSLNKLWPWKENVELLYTHSDGREDWLQSNVWPVNFVGDPQIGLAISVAIIGFGLILLMERMALKHTK